MPRRNRLEDPVNFIGYTTAVALSAGQAVAQDLGKQAEAVKKEIVFNVTDKEGALIRSLKFLGGVAELFAVPVFALALVQGYKYRNAHPQLRAENVGALRNLLWMRGTFGVLIPMVTAAFFSSNPDFLKPVALSAIPLGLTILDALATGFVVKGINS